MKKKLKTKDYILLGIFSLLFFAVNSAVGFILTPFMATSAMPLISGGSLFFAATVYMIMAMKIGKRGVLLFLSIVTGLIYALMGIPLLLVFFTLAGVLGEVTLIKGDGNQYRNVHRQALAYAVFGALFGMGAYVTVYVYGSDYLTEMYDEAMRESLMQFTYSPAWMIGGFLFSFVMSILGCLLATKILNKHFIKAGMVR
ncbi:energy-coupling factor transport system substrate-specific component [Bacillus horti]|uniref:Energy-coupling factor transport system substrate-specific component n=1 Tax=Caldalkalibacillus horti TaxID=77523 RepID=A0ABT9VWN3_9BACI|nr:energy-coupling factor transport system substrate-specific component [Bacillus horti]